MQPVTEARLLLLNRRFYQKAAAEFMATRERPWRGWEKLWPRLQSVLPNHPRILDVGCGQGRLAGQFLKYFPSGRYAGIDQESFFLREGKKRFLDERVSFFKADLSTSDWVLKAEGKFDLVVGFALMHHIPGKRLRLRLIKQMTKKVKAGGRLVLSFWRFEHNHKLMIKKAGRPAIEAAGLNPADLDPGDYLLPFGKTANNWRYCHSFSEAEVNQLLLSAGWRTVRTWSGDYASGGDNWYVWAELGEKQGQRPERMEPKSG